MALFGRRKPALEEDVVPAEVPQLPDPPVLNVDGLRTLSDHRKYVLSLVDPLPPFGLKLLDAWGLALYEDLRSEVDLPDAQVAAVDGYALRAADADGSGLAKPAKLHIRNDSVLTAGTAAPVISGQDMPVGADAVLPFDRAEVDGDLLTATCLVSAGDFSLAPGAHLRIGDTIARVGDRVDTRIVSLLAATGIEKVLVRPRPRIAVIGVGENAIDPGHQLGDGQSFDINSYLLSAAAMQDGATVWQMGAIPHEIDALKEVVADQLIRTDLILASADRHEDCRALEQVMTSLGMTDFADLAMFPGRHQGFGLIGEDRIPMLMLPGEANAAFISYQAIARPIIRKLMGNEPYVHQAMMCHTNDTITSDSRVLEFALAKTDLYDGVRYVSVLGDPRTPTLGDLAKANALVVLPEGKSLVQPGETVLAWALDGD